MAIDSHGLGRRVAEARQRAGLTQQDLAAATGLERSALAKVELGERRLTALELARIAESVGDRIEWFVLETPTAIVSHRNLLDPGQPSPLIDDEIERRVQAVEFVAREDPAFSLRDLQAHPVPTNAAEAAALATQARMLMDVPLDGPLQNLGDRVRALGLLVFVTQLGTDAADAATVLLERGAVSVVNGALCIGRRRLALAHEIGHALVADDYTIDWRVNADQPVDQRESMLDAFARALLLPADSLQRDWLGWLRESDLRTAAVRAASSYRVDMSTLARRLREDLGLIDSGDAARVRSVHTTRADIVELDLVVGEELLPDVLARDYETAVLRLYRREVVSAERARDLLFDTWLVDDLPALPSRPVDSIWQYVS